MEPARKRMLIGFLFVSSGALFYFPSAWAWDKHAPFTPAALQEISARAQAALSEPFPAPCPADDARIYAQLASELGLNPAASLAPTSPKACGERRALTGREILLGAFADDPDRGIDQDLPDTQDPQDFRKWMGGKRGETSQGFRHMYFGGWKLAHPITTFQLPPGAMGYAPERAEIFALKAREYFQAGKKAWGFRLLAWSLHYLQDLAQPFHSVQIPNPKMVPWFVLYTWPPSRAMDELVTETTRTISNFHYAYEQYIGARLLDQDPTAPFLDCMEQAKTFSKLTFDPTQQRISDLARKIARASIRLGPRLGEAEVGFFGKALMQRGVDLPAGKGTPDYADYAIRPDLARSRLELHQVTCEALSNAVLGSRFALDWALR